MTQLNLKRREGGAICTRCNHDLGVKKGDSSGYVFCSNRRCKFSKSPHPTRSRVNQGHK